MKKLLIAALMIAACVVFAGCGGGEGAVLNPDADKEGVTDDSWVKDVWDSAVQDMLDKGYAKEDPDDGVIFVCVNNGEIDLSEEGKTALTSEDFKIDGKVIWGSEYATMSETSEPRVDTSASPPEGQEETFPHYVSSYADESTKPEVFADTRGQCKYLILMTALCYNVAHEYYIGPLDRLDIVTYVFVIDAVNKEVVHIQFINSDSPGAVASSYMGKIYEENARHYMNSLCH